MRGASDFKVALLAPGPVSDTGWKAGAYDGLMRTRDWLRAPISYMDTKTPAEFEEAFRGFVSRRCCLVFGHWLEFQDAAAMVGDEFPNTVLITTSGSTVRASVPPMVFRLEEGTHRAGLLAGGMTRTGRLGFIGGIQLPPVVGVLHAARESPGVLAVGASREQNAVALGVIVAAATLDVAEPLLDVARRVHEGRFHAGRDSSIAGTVQVRRVESVSHSVPVARR